MSSGPNSKPSHNSTSSPRDDEQSQPNAQAQASEQTGTASEPSPQDVASSDPDEAYVFVDEGRVVDGFDYIHDEEGRRPRAVVTQGESFPSRRRLNAGSAAAPIPASAPALVQAPASASASGPADQSTGMPMFERGQRYAPEPPEPCIDFINNVSCFDRYYD
ncbi:MAG: hypothetical protein Q9159_000576 [Coniocarpon cinnabarinum]